MCAHTIAKTRAHSALPSGADRPAALIVFSSAEGNRSVARYAHELAESLATFTDARCVEPIVRSGFWQKSADKLKYLWRARQLAGDANLIVSTGYAFLLLALDGKRTVCVCHDLHPLIFPGQNWRERLLFRMNLRLLKRARAVVAVSAHTREQLLQNCPFLDPQRVFAIYNGLHPRWRAVTDRSRLEEFRSAHELQSKRFILHVGNDNWYKNFASLLQAVARIEERSLVLAKVGKLRISELRLIEDLRIQDRIVHFSELSDEQLVVLYNCAEALVFPSLHEGFGWPPLEAMACGCPVIAGDRPSLPEICGEAALYVDPEKPAEIAAAIARLRSEPGLRENLRRKGFEQAAKYDWKRTAESILALFNS